MTELKKGEIVTGLVTGIEPYGAFVHLDEYYNGLIHISEVSNEYVNDIKNYVNIGEKINVKILDVNDETNQAKLSIKDIDYRIDQPAAVKIEEVGQGFKPLQENLDKWLDDKLAEINKDVQ
jgi:general stress protein 13